MTRAVHIPGYRVKNGKVIKSDQHLDVSARLRRKGSKRIRPARRGEAK